MMKATNLPFGKLSRTDLHHLSVFMTVVEAGGFSAAQITLNVGQSTISRHMTELEERLGICLCKRGRAGFALTDQGRAVYESCQRLFGALERFRGEVGSLRGQMIGELAIGLIDNWVFDPRNPLPDVLSRFRDLGGDVRVTVRTLPPDEIEAAVLDGRLHLGIGVFHQKRRGLVYQDLYTDRMRLYCGRGHPFFDQEAHDLDMDEIQQADFIKRSYLSEEEIAPLADFRHSTATANQMESAAFLILSGKYIGFLPQSFAAIWEEKRQMKPLWPDRIFHKIQFSTLFRSGGDQSLTIGTFLKILDEEMAGA